MIGSMPMPHTITITTPTKVKDRNNNDVLTYDPATAVTVQGWLQPSIGSEYNVGRDAVQYEFVLYTLVSIDAHSRVTWEGRTYEVNGPNRPWSTPYGMHHFETYLSVMEG